MREPASPFDSVSPAPRGSASVPIAVYYQLAEELRGVKAHLAAAAERNATLTAQNQQLREQLDRLVTAAMQVQTPAAPVAPAPEIAPPPPPERPIPMPSPLVTGMAGAPLTLPSDIPPALPTDPALQDLAEWNALPDMGPMGELFAEQPVTPFPDGPSDRAAAPAGNWWTVVAIAAIGAMAFGVSFAIVRPLTQGQR